MEQGRWVLEVFVLTFLIFFQERPDLLLPWIILTVISFIFDWILIIGYMVYAVHAAWVSGLFLFAMGCYSFIVVWSYRYFDQN